MPRKKKENVSGPFSAIIHFPFIFWDITQFDGILNLHPVSGNKFREDFQRFPGNRRPDCWNFPFLSPFTPHPTLSMIYFIMHNYP